MNSFTIRRIPAPVERSLRRIARESNQSLNKTAIELIAKAAGITPEEGKTKKRRDLSSIFRPWSSEEYRDFQKHTEGFEVIDEELWRQ